VGRYEGNRPLGRPRGGFDGNTIKDLRWDGTMDRDKWLEVVNTLMKLRLL
jgi:hypothetical protein